jgi:hypothetical protein
MRTVVVPRLCDVSIEMGMTTRRFSEDAAFLWAMVEDDKRWVSSQAWQPTEESRVQWNQANLAYPTLVEKASHKSIHERYQTAISRLEGPTAPEMGDTDEEAENWAPSQKGSETPSGPPNSIRDTEERHNTPFSIADWHSRSDDGQPSERELKLEGKKTQECWFCYINSGSSYGGGSG